jgi:hypothetical protein
MLLVVTPASGTADINVTVGTGGTIAMDVHASFGDNVATIVPGTQNTIIGNTALTTVVSQNITVGVQRNVKLLQIYNNGTVPNTVTVGHTDGTTAVVLISATLAVGETLTYNENFGWTHSDNNGQPLLVIN